MLDLWTSIVNGLRDFLIDTINVFLALLPDCPFEKYISDIGDNDLLKYVNWIIPVGDFVIIASSWLVAIGVFYLYQVILRWLKVIGD